MKPLTLIIAAAAYIVGASVTFAIVRWLGLSSPELTFILGSIVATQAAIVMHHRSPAAENNLAAKCQLGAALAIVTGIFGWLLHLLFAPFVFADVSIPIATLGAFVFPFVLFNTLWSALTKSKGE